MNGGRCNEEKKGCVCGPGWLGLICNESCSEVRHYETCPYNIQRFLVQKNETFRKNFFFIFFLFLLKTLIVGTR